MANKSASKKQTKEVVNSYDYITKPWIYGHTLGDTRMTNHSEATTPSYVLSSDESKKED